MFRKQKQKFMTLDISCSLWTLRLRLHETGYVWDLYKIVRGKPCVYAGPGRSALDRLPYMVPNRFTCKSDPV